MIIKIKKPDFIPASKSVRFGYDDATYCDLFDNKEHVVHFYNTKKPAEYLVCLDTVTRSNNVGTVHVQDMKLPGNQNLIFRALKNDYGFEESEYEVTFV